MQSDNSIWDPEVSMESREGTQAIMSFGIRILLSQSSNKFTSNKKDISISWSSTSLSSVLPLPAVALLAYFVRK